MKNKTRLPVLGYGWRQLLKVGRFMFYSFSLQGNLHKCVHINTYSFQIYHIHTFKMLVVDVTQWMPAFTIPQVDSIVSMVFLNFQWTKLLVWRWWIWFCNLQTALVDFLNYIFLNWSDTRITFIEPCIVIIF